MLDGFLLALVALAGSFEGLVLFVLDLPLYDLLAALAHVDYLDAVDPLGPVRRVVQIVLESEMILVLLRPRAFGVAFLRAHFSPVERRMKFNVYGFSQIIDTGVSHVHLVTY